MNNNVTPLLLIAVSIALFYTYINPQYVKIEELRAQEERYIEALDRANEIQVIRDDLLAKFNSFTDEDMNRLETLLPDDVDNVKFVLDLDGIASKYGISIRNVRVTKPIADEMILEGEGAVRPYSSIRVAFLFDASYDDFIEFTKELEQSLRIVDVTAVSIRPAENGIYEYGVTLNTYWLK